MPIHQILVANHLPFILNNTTSIYIQTKFLRFIETLLYLHALYFRRRVYIGRASQNFPTIPFDHLIWPTGNTVVVFLKHPPQGIILKLWNYLQSVCWRWWWRCWRMCSCCRKRVRNPPQLPPNFLSKSYLTRECSHPAGAGWVWGWLSIEVWGESVTLHHEVW